MTIKMPFTAKLMTTNQVLASQPGVINEDPFGAGWIVKMEPGAAEHVDALLDAEGYEASLACSPTRRWGDSPTPLRPPAAATSRPPRRE